MNSRHIAILGLTAAVVGAACEARPDAPAGDAAHTPAHDVQAVVRTADPVARGLPETDFPRVQELAPGVYSYEQLRSAGEERFTTVSMFVVTPDGVLVADGQGSVEETARLVRTIAEVTNQPITHVVVCSDHGDHTAGNSAFPEGVEFVAHPSSLANLEAAASRADPDTPPVPLPTVLVSDRQNLSLGGREIEVLFLGRAHTGGDLVVHLPEEKILFMSEAYLNRIFPAMRSAYPSEWVDMLARAQAMDIDVYVPGHGFVEDPRVLEQELDTFRLAVAQVVEEGRRMHDDGLSADAAVERMDFGSLESWSLRDSQAETALRRVYMELDGGLPSG